MKSAVVRSSRWRRHWVGSTPPDADLLTRRASPEWPLAQPDTEAIEDLCFMHLGLVHKGVELVRTYHFTDCVEATVLVNRTAMLVKDPGPILHTYSMQWLRLALVQHNAGSTVNLMPASEAWAKWHDDFPVKKGINKLEKYETQ